MLIMLAISLHLVAFFQAALLTNDGIEKHIQQAQKVFHSGRESKRSSTGKHFWLPLFSLDFTPKMQQNILLHSCINYAWNFGFNLIFFLPEYETSFEHIRKFSWTFSKIFLKLCILKICKVVFWYILMCCQLISSSDKKNIL